MPKGKPATEADVKARLKKRGFRLLEKFSGLKLKHTFRCPKRHEWTAVLKVVLLGLSGCPTCANHGNRIPKAEVERRLRPRGIRLLDPYTRSDRHHRFKCKNGHVWSTAPAEVFRGKGCPTCPTRVLVKEGEVRRVIEKLTGWKFPRAWPDFLRGRNGHRLELDGYNARHKIAFECQGYQHYEAGHWGGGEKELRLQKKRDLRKRVQCLRHGVTLICVPYWTKDVRSFIQRKLGKGK